MADATAEERKPMAGEGHAEDQGKPMTPEQAAAFVIAQAACASAEVAAMQQTNDAFVASFAERGAAVNAPYTANDFRAVADRFCIGHNAVVQLFQDVSR